MTRRPAKLPDSPRAKARVYFFKRSVETREGVLKALWTPSDPGKVAVPELAVAGNGGGAHRAILVRTLRPDHFRLRIDPQSEPHK